MADYASCLPSGKWPYASQVWIDSCKIAPACESHGYLVHLAIFLITQYQFEYHWVARKSDSMSKAVGSKPILSPIGCRMRFICSRDKHGKSRNRKREINSIKRGWRQKYKPAYLSFTCLTERIKSASPETDSTIVLGKIKHYLVMKIRHL